MLRLPYEIGSQHFAYWSPFSHLSNYSLVAYPRGSLTMIFIDTSHNLEMLRDQSL